MLRSLLRNKNKTSFRKHFNLPPKRFEPVVIKKRNFIYEDLIDYEKQKEYSENKFFYDTHKQIDEKVKNKIKSQKKMTLASEKKDYSDKNVKEFLDGLEYDEETGIMKKGFFEKEILYIKERSNNKDVKKFDKFKEIINNMVTNLNLMTEYEVLQFQKHSIALRLSGDFVSQAKGVLLKICLDDFIGTEFQSEEQKEIKIKNLIDKIALKIVYNKIENIIISKQEGSSYESNDVLDFFLKDPLFEANGVLIQKIVNQIYSISTEFKIENNEDYLLNDETKMKFKIQENYFKARAFYISQFLNISLSNYYFFNGVDIGLNYPKLFNDIKKNKKEMLNENEEEVEILTIELKKILGHSEVTNDLNSKIKLLEKSIKTSTVELDSVDLMSKQLDMLLHELPMSLKEKYFKKENETEYRYLNNSFNAESLLWKNLDLEIPSSIMPVDYYIENEKQKDKRNKIQLMRGIEKERSEEEIIKDEFENNSLNEFYENSDLEIDENVDVFLDDYFPSKNKTEEKKHYQQILKNFQLKEEEFLKKIEKKKENKDKSDLGVYIDGVPQEDELNKVTKKLFYKNVTDELFEKLQELEEVRIMEENNQLEKKKKISNILNKHRQNIQNKVSNIFTRNRYGKNVNEELITSTNDFEYEDDLVKPFFQNDYEKINIEEPEDKEVFEDYLEYIEKSFQTEVIARYTSKNVEMFEKEQRDDEEELSKNSNLSDNYQYALEYYKEFNSSLFYKHYIADNFKLINQFNPDYKFDFLAKEEDPNIGLYLNSLENKILINHEDIQMNKLDIIPSRQKSIDPLNLEKNQREMLQTFFKNEKELEENLLKKNFFGQGKRKKARAVGIIQIPGTGKVTVNHREFTEYFSEASHRFHVLKPIFAANQHCNVDVKVFVYGSGLSKQADAAKIALAKALIKAFPEIENHFYNLYMTFTDDRRVERKKTGLPKARKGITYVRR